MASPIELVTKSIQDLWKDLNLTWNKDLWCSKHGNINQVIQNDMGADSLENLPVKPTHLRICKKSDLNLKWPELTWSDSIHEPINHYCDIFS